MGVDLLVNKLPPKARSIAHLITDIIVLALNGYVTYLSYMFIVSSKVKTMPVLKISSVYLNAALILGFGLMAIYSLANCIVDIKQLAKGNFEEGEAA